MNLHALLLPNLLAATFLTAGLAAQGFGAVYTLGNDPAGNAVRVTLRLPNGSLLPFAEFATGGAGTGGGLGSQGALAVSPEGQHLLAVSPGSNELSLFRVFADVFLWRTDVCGTDGLQPTSVALHDDLVYVLNAGSDDVRGFRRQGARLVPIAGAQYPLSQTGAAAAQVGFSPDGDFLVVTERATDTIGVFPVLPNGMLGAGVFQPSAGPTPFGFLFRDDGTLVVSEAAGGAPGASVVSSYRIQPNGVLQVITAAAATNQAAACWIAIPRHGRFAYSTNTADGTISGFALSPAGTLSLLTPNGVTGDLGSAARPLDFEFTPNGRFLYVLDAGGDRIRGFLRRNDGSLVLLGTSVGLEDGAAGLIVR